MEPEEQRRALILANGYLGEEGIALSNRPWSLVVAADGGLRHAFKLRLKVHAVIGDFDSAPNELVQLATRDGAEVVRYPEEKDKTDLELAIDFVFSRGVTDITIAGALGGRVDHELANIFLPASPAYTNHSITLVGPACTSPTPEPMSSPRAAEIHVARDSATIEGSVGDIVSLLPLGVTASGVTTEGLRYPLHDDVLELGSSRGVSNVMTSGFASVTVASGLLLLIHLRPAA